MNPSAPNPLQLPLVRGRAEPAPPLTRGGWEGFEFPSRRSTRSAGFTLIELLVALLVFSLLAIAGYRGLNALLQTRAQLDQETRKYQALSRFFNRMDEQLGQVVNRPVRAANGMTQAALVGYPAAGGVLEEAQLVFTRAGGVDAAGGLRLPQRIGYRLRNNTIQMLRWEVLDQAPGSKPLEDAVLEGVREFNLRYLSQAMTWNKQWAPATAAVPPPKAVEVELVLANGEKMVRIFSLQ